MVEDPHANKDEAIGIDDDDGTDPIDDRSMQQIDRQIRITLKDCQRFGFTEGCPRCRTLRQAHIVPTHITMTIVDSECIWRFVMPTRQNGEKSDT